MTKDLGTSAWVDVEDCVPFKWVRFLRLRAIIDRQVGVGGAGHPIEPGRVRISMVKIHFGFVKRPTHGGLFKISTTNQTKTKNKKKKATGVVYTRADAQVGQPLAGYLVERLDTTPGKSATITRDCTE
jgi:hypothetical protein